MQNSREQQEDNKGFLSKKCKKKKKKNRGKLQNGKDQRSFQENQRYQGNISFKDGYQDRNSKDLKEAEKIEMR